MGHIVDLGDGRWRVEVERGYRTDGRRRRECRTVTGTQAQAQIVAAQLAADMGRSDAYGDSVTLDEWYLAFRDRPSVRGTPRAPNTLAYYDQSMRKHISPALGAVPLSRITHEMVSACVRASSSPTSTKTTLRAVLRAAYDEGLMPSRPMDRRVPVHAPRMAPHEPWSRFEAMAAISADWPDPMLAAYLVLGLSGLRKEEALGVRPVDVREASTYSVATGEVVTSLVVDVAWTYTRLGGHRHATKSDATARTVPVLVPGRPLLLRSMSELRDAAEDVGAWAMGRLVDLDTYAFDYRWEKALKSLGLRHIPPKMLRHTSSTIMETAGVSPDLADKMHGRSDHSTTYRNYYRPDVALMEEAASKVGQVLGASPELPGRQRCN